jgi:hypothetical protein
LRASSQRYLIIRGQCLKMKKLSSSLRYRITCRFLMRCLNSSHKKLLADLFRHLLHNNCNRWSVGWLGYRRPRRIWGTDYSWCKMGTLLDWFHLLILLMGSIRRQLHLVEINILSLTVRPTTFTIISPKWSPSSIAISRQVAIQVAPLLPQVQILTRTTKSPSQMTVPALCSKDRSQIRPPLIITTRKEVPSEV